MMARVGDRVVITAIDVHGTVVDVEGEDALVSEDSGPTRWIPERMLDTEYVPAAA